MLPDFMSYFPYFFPFFFIGIWIFITFLISKKGWTYLAASYHSGEAFYGTKVGIISAYINGVHYKNSLVLKYNPQGIYMQPVWLFRLFHKPVLIPWKAIQEVRDKRMLFYAFKELVIGYPSVAIIGLPLNVFFKLEPYITKSSIV